MTSSNSRTYLIVCKYHKSGMIPSLLPPSQFFLLATLPHPLTSFSIPWFQPRGQGLFSEIFTQQFITHARSCASFVQSVAVLLSTPCPAPHTVQMWVLGELSWSLTSSSTKTLSSWAPPTILAIRPCIPVSLSDCALRFGFNLIVQLYLGSLSSSSDLVFHHACLPASQSL